MFPFLSKLGGSVVQAAAWMYLTFVWNATCIRPPDLFFPVVSDPREEFITTAHRHLPGGFPGLRG